MNVNIESISVSLYLHAGGPLPVSALLSGHVVDSEEECWLICLEKNYCLGLNFNSRITNKYSCKVNCQISGRNIRNTEVRNECFIIMYKCMKKMSTFALKSPYIMSAPTIMALASSFW